MFDKIGDIRASEAYLFDFSPENFEEVFLIEK